MEVAAAKEKAVRGVFPVDGPTGPIAMSVGAP